MADTVLNESILNSIKKLLGINTSDIVFDQDITIHINTVFANLVQMGIGPSNGYMITSENNEWKEFCEWIESLPYAKELIVGDE